MTVSSKSKKNGYLRQLLSFDQHYKDVLPERIIGLDEVGRGCLAGPVVAAAVCLPEIKPRSALGKQLSRLRDSKQLSKEERTELALLLHENAQCAIAEASVEEIEEINILHASLLAMKRARKLLKLIPEAVLLIDGNMSVPGLGDVQIPLVKGDNRSAAIAAASIIAKVYRDKLMSRLALLFPQYGWEQNKGYGSAEHRQSIEIHGVTPWHRLSFIKSAVKENDLAQPLEQLALPLV